MPRRTSPESLCLEEYNGLAGSATEHFGGDALLLFFSPGLASVPVMFYDRLLGHMDWPRTIETNQAALTRIVAALIAMVGLAAQGAARLPRPLYHAALRVLRPAESAVRRLIVIAARGVAVKPYALRPMPAGLALSRSGGGRA